MNKVLIVDDDPALVEFLKLLLDSEGYETEEASDGAMALDQVAGFGPEVVLLDYMMPNMDGLDVLRNVTKNFGASFVVMLTGKGSEEVAVECMKAGAVDYVVKPFDNDRLISVVRNAFRFREAELQKRAIMKEIGEKRAHWQSLINQATELLDELKPVDPSNRIAEAISLLTRLRDDLE